MKEYVFLRVLAVSCSFILPSAYSAPRQISLEEVAEHVRKQNLTVKQNTERVYQARQAIRVARANLLPKLNLWRLSSSVIDGRAFLGVLEDLVPFLMPNKWLEMKQQKLFYQAELQAAKALKANEIYNAKSLYFQALSDSALIEHLRRSLDETEKVMSFVRTQEVFGKVPVGTSRTIEIRALALADDLKEMELLLKQEAQQLSLMLSLPESDVIEFVSVPPPSLDTWSPLAAETIVSEAIPLSPELRQFDYLIRAAAVSKKAVLFSVLGASSASRGVAGGVFDAYPVQDGLGFGLGPSVKIARSQKRQIGLQKEGAREALVRQILATVDQYNADLDRYGNIRRRSVLAREAFDILGQRLQLGGEVSGLELIEASHQLISARTDELGLITRALQTDEKIQRILLDRDYREQRN